MHHVHEILWLDACRYASARGSALLVQALGEVPTSDWSDARLAPRFYAAPPADGLLEFDFRAQAPSGRVLDCALKVTASIVVACPPWLVGVKVYAATNHESSTQLRAAEEIAASAAPALAPSPCTRTGRSQPLAVYEDHFAAGCGIARRRQRHELTLCIDGPDPQRILDCMDEIAASRLAAHLVAAYPVGGSGLSEAVGRLLERLSADLGSAYVIRFHDRARWLAADDAPPRVSAWPADGAAASGSTTGARR